MANPYDKIKRMDTLKLSDKEKQLVFTVLQEAQSKFAADNHAQGQAGILRAVLTRLAQ